MTINKAIELAKIFGGEPTENLLMEFWAVFIRK
ncbi:hypothetical protein L6279_05255 [Candidatus Parcubacteria bacterium]|nr:hypothetical protein [Candidatus Parcubacteria bacterium]